MKNHAQLDKVDNNQSTPNIGTHAVVNYHQRPGKIVLLHLHYYIYVCVKFLVLHDITCYYIWILSSRYT